MDLSTALVKSVALLGEARSFLETQKDTLQELFDERSSHWQESTEGEETQQTISDLEEVIAAIEDMETQLENLKKG